MRLILHPGPPKTATSALQSWCYENRGVLAENGIHYATVDTPHDPKHQWLMKALKQGDLSRLEDEIQLFQAGNAHTLILSCEGVMVNRSLLAAQTWHAFRTILSDFDITLFMVRRDPERWLASLWKQRIINPVARGKILDVPDFEEFKNDKAVRQMIDLPTMSSVMQAETGADRTVTAEMGPAMLAEFQAVLGLPTHVKTQTLPIANEALPDAFISVYRQLARHAEDGWLLRLAFFSVFATIEPTNNIMIGNVARRYESAEPHVRARSLACLLAALDAVVLTRESDLRLAGAVREMSKPWFRNCENC
ncbi:hypothetical protein E4191_07505 [Paracoccus liaowanqingii]|uniref:Sulfotransferase family protein n=1 Tax=Paracoccus liaowanqingii TaxID=2560053 RepID=A0A4V1BJ01_9RHOB|nr:hypothetical protein [Paracoccus liaowanqingii]QBX34572.1 hypothetical protein E4191_07505 [Paracoccus liaowanqingii]